MKTKMYKVPEGIEIEGCIKLYFNDYEVSLSTLGNIPTIRIYKGEEDVTESISGLSDIYGDYQNLVKIFNILENRKGLF